MKFVSTRNSNICVNSKQAIIDGLANDGGLYVPIKIHKIKNLYNLKDLNYQDLAFNIISNIFDDIDKNDLRKIINESYNTNFIYEDITPINKINNKYFLDLSAGPTSAFKDIALQFLPRLLCILNDDNKKIVILTATSGDTGKAALEGFKNLNNTAIKVLYPYKMVSTIQERQMTTTDGNNTEVIAVKGNFDDCQKLVKDIMQNETLDNIHLTSANSINIARLIAQCVYYFKAYFDLLNSKEIEINQKVDFIVPTGNFGDILAGYLAKLMGLPINKLVIASNSNNVLTDFVNTGEYNANRVLYNTISPSIDILISSNLERLLYLISEDDSLVNKLMNDLKIYKTFKIDDSLLNKIKDTFLAFDCSEDECLKTIKDYYDKYNYLIDTHTAIATKVSEKYQTTCPQIILATASAFKFSKDVYYAITNKKIKDDLDAMNILNEYTNKSIPVNLAKLKTMKIIHSKVINKDDKEYIIESLRKIK